MEADMPKLKLAPITHDKPVKVTLELPASLHRELVTYADILNGAANGIAGDPIRLIVPMLERFIASDRGFARARRGDTSPSTSNMPQR
jgi:hypothetical protein